MNVKPLTREHLEAYRKKNDKSAIDLRQRAEYCDFMAATAHSPFGAELWRESANRRRREAAALATERSK